MKSARPLMAAATGSEGDSALPRVAIDRPAPATGLTRVQWMLEIMLRIGTVAIVSIFLTSLVRHYLLDTARISLLVFAFAEALTVALSVFSRIPSERDWSPVSVIMSCAASFYYLAFRVEPGIHLIAETAAVAIQIFGVLIAIGAKWSLRRSFGILPANRGVVVKGPYRLVRHPMYLGYLVKDVGFVLPNFGLQNLVVVLVFWSLQIGRIIREERLLSNDPIYKDYKKRVPFRLMTGIF